MNESISQKLNDLKTEDLIWIIYFFLAISALLSNYYEKDSILNNKTNSKRISKNINITVFTISLFIYLYFVYLNYRDIEQIKKGYVDSTNKHILENQARLIAAILFLVGGTIYLITEINSATETEVGFIWFFYKKYSILIQHLLTLLILIH